MGLLSSIGKIVFGDPSDDIRKATEQQQKGITDAREYLQGIDKLPLQLRNQALQNLSGYYMGDPSAQQAFVDSAMQSPFYQSMVQQGEEAVLRNAAATGGLRSGTTSQNLARVNQNVLQNLVNQQLKGQSAFTNPALNTANIANMYAGYGQAGAQGTMAEVNANQQLAGQTLQAILAGTGMYGQLAGLGGFGGGGGKM